MRASTLILVLSLAFLCAGCSMTPVTQGSLEAQLQSQADLQELALVELERGNDTTAVVLAGMAGLTSVFTTIGLSRKRRALAALQNATGKPVIPSLQPAPV
jgi:hypothetical protein